MLILKNEHEHLVLIFQTWNSVPFSGYFSRVGEGGNEPAAQAQFVSSRLWEFERLLVKRKEDSHSLFVY
jgi:hypothetical protein